MFTLLAPLAVIFAAFHSVEEETGFAHQLMESADACAGNSPHHAQELREAALAYLSVVR